MVPKVGEVKELGEDGENGGEDENNSIKNEKWKILYKFKAAFNPIMPSREGSDGICPLGRHDSCPPGHQLESCPDRHGAYYCKQCSELSFQPDENWLGDKCRRRVVCGGGKFKETMFYISRGSTTRDAVCGCVDGYYLPNVMDPRACFANPICDPGSAPGKYGVCESCLEKGMYSDTRGPITKRCKPLTNCAKQGKCLEVASDGTFDNICGPMMGDTPCRKIEPSSSSYDFTPVMIAACVGGVALVLIFILAFIFYRRQKRYRSLYGRQQSGKVFTTNEMEQIQLKVLKESERDPALCRKAISASFSFIEERIGRQIWPLAQELFRSHPIEGKYELIVEKYKDCQAKYTVNGYLTEWRQWRGENREAVAELFQCLKQINREDIVNETCSYLRNDIEIISDPEQHRTNKSSFRDECTFIFFPCCYTKKEKAGAQTQQSANTQVVVENDLGEAGTKLLGHPTDDTDDANNDEGGDGIEELKKRKAEIYQHNHPTPSAPAFEDVTGIEVGGAEPAAVKFSRQYSQPVQATS